MNCSRSGKMVNPNCACCCQVEQYNDLLEARAALDKHDPRFNAISLNDEDDVGAEKDSRGHDNELDGKAKEIKDEYGRLHRMATNTQPKEFEEEKAQGGQVGTKRKRRTTYEISCILPDG